MIVNIVKLGWKNVWRNPMRSAVVVTAVLLGTWAGIFAAGFFNGMLQDTLNNQIELSIGHIQISHPEFEDLYDPEYTITDAEEVIHHLEKQPFVTDITAKSLASGLAQSTRSSFGVTINGINPKTDSTSVIEQYLREGSMIESSSRNEILIGSKLADRLNLDLKQRMVLSFQDIEGEITGGAFRVSGIFKTFNSNFNENTVFVLDEDLNRLLGSEQAIHNIRITTDDLSQAESYANQLRPTYPNLDIKTWRSLAPDLRYIFDMMDLTLYIVMIIIIIGLVFSIINTMLMAVMERTRELGMLRAIGMNKIRTFSMIMYETLFLTIVGAPAGLLLGWTTITYFGNTGINLGIFAEGLSMYGMGTMIYPTLSWIYYLNIMLMIAGAALLSALYPAWKSIQLKPVEAIRKFN
ncbi:MAG: ABC transporter permease [Bacteroidota bacterium]